MEDTKDGLSTRSSALDKVSDLYQSSGNLSSLHVFNWKTIESWRSHSDPSIRSMPSQNAHDNVSPFKRSIENEKAKGAIKMGSFASTSPIKANLGYSGQGRNKRGFAFSLGSSMLFSFVSIYMLIGMLGTRSPRYNLKLVPSLGTIHRPHRRIQEDIVLDTFKGGVFDHDSVRMKELPACDVVEEDFVPCYKMLGESNDRHCEIRKQCLIPPPNGYKIPPRWPASSNGVWNGNIKFTGQLGLSGERLTR